MALAHESNPIILKLVFAQVFSILAVNMRRKNSFSVLLIKISPCLIFFLMVLRIEPELY